MKSITLRNNVDFHEQDLFRYIDDIEYFISCRFDKEGNILEEIWTRTFMEDLEYDINESACIIIDSECLMKFTDVSLFQDFIYKIITIETK